MALYAPLQTPAGSQIRRAEERGVASKQNDRALYPQLEIPAVVPPVTDNLHHKMEPRYCKILQA